ncbi:MAG: hypothetical protein PHC50_06190 [Candidatus Cloacimonetes bacterium]|nr:hypothetical protein [Candidatus Cloacimonadota bacterium]
MAIKKVTEVQIVDPEYLDSTGWQPLKYLDTSNNPKVIKQVVLFQSVAGVLPSTISNLGVNWANFNNGEGQANATIFGVPLPLNATDKSIKIRYKIMVISLDDDIGNIHSVSEDYAYMMINMGFSSTKTLSGLPGELDGGKLEAIIAVECPAFPDTPLGSDYTAVRDVLKDSDAWKAKWTPPKGSALYIDPGIIILEAVKPSETAEHGGYSIKAKLPLNLPVNIDGEYRLDIQWLKDSGSAYTIPQNLKATALITINKAAVESAVYVSGSTTDIELSFS